MTSVFSSIVRPASSRRPKAQPRRDAHADREPECSHADDEPDLGDLNASLQALTDIFPDIQPEVFREMLLSFSAESRLQVVTETLLKHAAKWVRGRYRMPAEHDEQRQAAQKYRYRTTDDQEDTRGTPLAIHDTFRTRSYRDAAKEALYCEFKGLPHSTIKAVLAEYNWSYTPARTTLLSLASRSWRSSITNFLLRRKPPKATDHPLVVWTTADATKCILQTPLLVRTKSHELNQELHESLIVPELERQRKEQLARDFEIALQYNEAEAEDAQEMYDCECCFVPNTLQQMSACDVEGHYICFRCIRFAINAALYDQGWARNISTQLCTLRCIAPVAESVEDCSGCVPFEFVKRALLEDQDGEDTLTKLDERFSYEAMLKSKLPLVRCPFCTYAEVDPQGLSGTMLFSSMRPRRTPLLLASVPLLNLVYFQVFQLALQCLVAVSVLITVLDSLLPKPLALFAPFHATIRRIHQKRRGLRFQCLSPRCNRASCVNCAAPWHDPHACYSSQRQSLRLTLERATTDAVKRTCPNCNLGFVKSEGCNKLVCLCGYSMCYVCRQGLANEGYQHFCQHFRERPGMACAECDKCDLYRLEDDEVIVQRARDRAEMEWWSTQGGNGTSHSIHHERGHANQSSGHAAFKKQKTWELWLEDMLERLIA